jgi:hypothetical protein
MALLEADAHRRIPIIASKLLGSGRMASICVRLPFNR